MSRHNKLSEHNGYIFVDPDVKAGKYAIADPDSGSSRRVWVHSLNNIFALVSDRPDSPRYGLMRGRLVSEGGDDAA